MRGKSHISLGYYLLDKYLPNVPLRYQYAFLLGCIEPDRNPATYLKGSIRCQWLRGHNFENARRFMHRISRRLERKESLNLLDYYTLGKLIHYTSDAFTYTHNKAFSDNLSYHRKYEANLQNHFLNYLQIDPFVDLRLSKTIMESITNYHREYSEASMDIHRDCQFALQACCCVLAILITPKII